MVATKLNTEGANLRQLLISTAVALGSAAVLTPAQAEQAPDKAEMSFKLLRYREHQPSLERVAVNSPSFALTVPIAGVWSLDTTAVTDQVSGASPRYHTVVSSASKMSDLRHAADLKLTRYYDRMKWSVGASFSNEHDYDSKALSLEASFSSEDNNRTWNFGLGASSDKISATGRNVHETRHGNDFMLGVSQVLTPQDLAQMTWTHTEGRGYFSDPYKSLDIRPRERKQDAWLLRHNHYFAQAQGTLRLSYRYYSDSFAIRAHTVGVEYAQALGDSWVLTPSLRLYSQTAADFYFDPRYTFLYIPVGYEVGGSQFVSEDQRLSAFGARTLGFKLSKILDEHWQFDVKLERYQQRSDWAWSGRSALSLAPLDAAILQVGLRYRF